MVKIKNILVLSFALTLFLFLSACTPPDEAAPSTIAGGVFFDCDKNGDCDTGDCGIEDMRIRLYADSCGGDILQTATTNEEGEFQFSGLEPGEYCVFPDFKFEMCGYGGNYPTNAISRKVSLEPGHNADLTWFGMTRLEGDP